MRVGGWLLLIAAVLGLPVAASAQDAGQMGITMGYPESIGLMWHVTNKVAVRPEFRFAHASTETDTALPVGSTNTSVTSVGVGVSALFYFRDSDNLRPYVAPRWTYSHSEPSSGSSSTTNTIAGLVGAQYSLSKRFSVFGETGVSYGHSKANADVSIFSLAIKGNGFATQTGAGVIVYF